MKQPPPSRDRWAAAKAAAEARRAAAPPRNRALVIADVVASIVLLLFLLGLALLVAGNATLYAGLHQACTPELAEGLTCNGTVLSVASTGLIVVAVVGLLLAIGMVIVRFIQRRWAFWWPLVIMIVLIASFWLGTWAVGLTIPEVVVP